MMGVSSSVAETIVRRFDEAAPFYDESASVQAEVAQHLVDWAMPLKPPADVLDLGTGTGMVAEAVANRWPRSKVTVLDHAPGMLQQAQRKMPALNVIMGDAARIDLATRYDAIFTSMMLHWLAEPRKILKRWQGWLKPGGSLYGALLVPGSFQEWRDLCRHAGLKDGLWQMPPTEFADGLTARTEQQTLLVTYPSATEFIRRLKSTGAATPRAGYHPFTPATMRKLLKNAPRPFSVSYETLYIELPSSPNMKD